MQKKRKLLTKKNILLVILAILLFFIINIMSFGIPKQDNNLYHIELSEVADGTFKADYKIVPPFGTFVANKRFSVEVTVNQHRITNVTILHPVGLKKLFSEVNQRIIQEQTSALDGISGATWSKRAYLKAVESALKAGRKLK